MRFGVLFYIVRRLLALGLLVVFVSFATFSLVHVAPGDPVDFLLGPNNPRLPETIEAIRAKYHLDEPFLTQYWIWVKDAVQLDFGESIMTSLPVNDEITRRLPTSLFLALYAFILTMVFGISLGLAAALRRRTRTDQGLVSASVLGLSTPPFVAGIFLLYVFAVLVDWFPVFGGGEGFFDQLWHLTLPAVALAVTSTAWVMKHTRASVIGVLDQDYVVFAKARGLSQTRIVFFYALRNGMIPVLTIAGLLLGGLIVGAVFVEVLFSLPGIGGLLVNSAINKDVPTVQGVALLVAVFIMVANLLADLAYMAVDPRIRLGRRAS